MFDQFEKIVVINLPERVDRRREAEAELSRVGCDKAEFFSAIKPQSAGKFERIGYRGAFLSHLEVIRSAQGARNVLIMEDDVKFTADFERRAALPDQLPLDWDVFYAGHMFLPEHRREWSETGLIEIGPDVEFVGLHCYAVNRKAVGPIVAAFERFMAREPDHPDGGSISPDGALNLARRQEDLRSFAAVPPLADQRASRSSIAELAWFDRLPVVRDAAAFARRLKNRAG